MLGTMDRQTQILDADQLCGHLVGDGSIHRKLAQLGDKLFIDEDFADLFALGRGRHSVPPSLLAKVMLLQSLEGTSDRETVDRVRCDLRWKVALHLPLDDEAFHPTVLTYFRERLRNSERPRRIFDPDDGVIVPASAPVASFGSPFDPKPATLGINPSSSDFLGGKNLLRHEERRRATPESIRASDHQGITHPTGSADHRFMYL